MSSCRALICGLLAIAFPSFAHAETSSRAAVRKFIAGKGEPDRNTTVTPRAEHRRSHFTVEHKWKNGNGLTVSELSVRHRSGRTALKSNSTQTASNHGQTVTLSYPKSGLFGYSLKKDETTFTPINNGWMANEVRVLRDGSEHAMFRSVVHGDRVTYTSDVFSSNSHEAKYGDKFSFVSVIPMHLLPRGDVGRLDAGQKIALREYLSGEGHQALNEFMNRKRKR